MASSHKGAFSNDEPGIVISSTNTGRSLKQIYEGAAFTAQPPLEYIIREKLYTPLGYKLNLASRFPELFHRGLSYLWWLLPISYFSMYLDKFKSIEKLSILASFLLLISSDFFRFYMAEARHYSAIAAVTFTIVLTLFRVVPKRIIRYDFLIIATFLPLLHIVSFSVYISFVASYLTYLYLSKSVKLEKHRNLLIFNFSYVVFILFLYVNISKISSIWQHSDIKNTLEINYVNSYMKWTLDWGFYKTIIYPAYQLIPSIIKNNLVQILLASNLLILPYIFNKFKNKEVSYFNKYGFLLIVTLIWPLTIITFSMKSLTFAGERYSISFITILFLLICYLTVRLIYKTCRNKTSSVFFSCLFILTIFVTFMVQVNTNKTWSYRSDEDVFTLENNTLINNADNVIVADNGAYSGSLKLYPILRRSSFNSNLIECRFGNYIKGDKNSINDILTNNTYNKIYIFSPVKSYMNLKNVVWQSGDRVLYKFESPIPQEYLCTDINNIKSDCYASCFKGRTVSENGREIPGVVTHLDIWRN
jgi:hypothetical protein